MDLKNIVISVFLLGISCIKCERLLQTLTATVSGEGYTHYRLSTQGRLLVTLESIVGDADLYVSDHTLSPAYDDYVMQSNTCGKDEVIISSHMTRPIGIAIYGHPNYDSSEFRLSIYFVAPHDDADYNELARLYNTIEDAEDAEKPPTPGQPHSAMTGDQEHEETFWSVVGTVLSTILKIVFEVIL